MHPKYTFLIIEEDKDVAEIMKEVMSRREVRLHIVTDLRKAGRILNENTVDVVVLTHHVETAEELKVWERARKLNPKVIWISLPVRGFPRAFVDPLSQVLYIKSVIETQAKIVDEFSNH